MCAKKIYFGYCLLSNIPEQWQLRFTNPFYLGCKIPTSNVSEILRDHLTKVSTISQEYLTPGYEYEIKLDVGAP